MFLVLLQHRIIKSVAYITACMLKRVALDVSALFLMHSLCRVFFCLNYYLRTGFFLDKASLNQRKGACTHFANNAIFKQ